jgi:hypothetical protein
LDFELSEASDFALLKSPSMLLFSFVFPRLELADVTADEMDMVSSSRRERLSYSSASLELLSFRDRLDVE